MTKKKIKAIKYTDEDIGEDDDTSIRYKFF